LSDAVIAAPARPRPGLARMALYVLLGFSAGLPFYMFSTVLSARLGKHGIDLVLIGFFGWVSLLPTFKFLWAPLLDRFEVPGFGRFFGKRLGWIILAQIGIFLSMVAMAFTSADTDLAMVALFAVLLSFWTTTLEVSADAWRIELAPTAEEQGPLTAANLWGYRSAMALSSFAALAVADAHGWTWGYLAVALFAFLPLPILATMPRQRSIAEEREELADTFGAAEPRPHGERMVALTTGLIASAVVLGGSLLVTAIAGWLVLRGAAAIGFSPKTDVKTGVLVACLLPFVIMAAALPWIVRLGPDAPARRSTWLGPYVDIFWRFRYMVLPLLGFVTFYRMGDVLTLWGVKPLEIAVNYDLTTMGVADGFITTPSSMAGVALGAFLAVRLRMVWALVIGAAGSALGNWIFVWLFYAPPSALVIYTATALDQFAHGLEGAVFVVYLSLLVNPKYPAAQYAFLSGFAFLLPRLLQGAGGEIVKQIGFNGFFWLSGSLSLAAVVFLPFIARLKPRPDDA
jgi:MFS transporter, PAT family, beta-lactamase induction signal transducer AmpG